MSRVIFVFCCIAMMVVAVSVNLMPVCLPALGQGLEGRPLDHEQLGRIAAMTFIGLVTAILIAGPLANRYSARWFTTGGCLTVALGLALLARARTYNEVLLAVGLMGLGGGALDMILSPLVCALNPRTRTVTLNWLHSFYCVGAVVTTLIATIAFGARVNWQTLASWLIIPSLLVGIAFLFLPLPPLLAQSEQRAKVRDLVRERFFILAMATIFLGGATEAGLAQWLPAFAELELGFSRVAGSTSLLAFSVGMALGRMVVSALNNRYSIYRILTWGCVSTVALFLVAGFCSVPWIALGAAIASGFTGSCLWPSTIGVAADRYPLGSASMFGLLAALGNVGGIFMPWGVGVIADRSTIAFGLAATAFCPLLMLVTLAAMQREKPTTNLLGMGPATLET